MRLNIVENFEKVKEIVDKGTENLPELHRTILFLAKEGMGCFVGGKYTDMYRDKYIRYKKLIEDYFDYFLTLYENWDYFRTVIYKYITAKRTREVFLDIVKNPLRTSIEVGRKFNITDSCVRVHVHMAIKKLKKTNNKKINMILKKLFKCLFMQKSKLRTLK